jgi:hypothetical protein
MMNASGTREARFGCKSSDSLAKREKAIKAKVPERNAYLKKLLTITVAFWSIAE